MEEGMHKVNACRSCETFDGHQVCLSGARSC